MTTDERMTGARGEAGLFVRTLERIYEAATDSERWQDVIDDLCRAFPGGRATLLNHDLSSGKGSFARTSGWDPAWVDAYNAHYNLNNPWLPNLKKRPVGRAVQAEFMLEREKLRKTEFFHDFLKPQSLVSGIGVTIAQNENAFVAVSVLYPEITDQHSERNVNYLQRLAPHLERAIQVNRRIEASDTRGLAAEETLNKLRVGVLLTSCSGKILFMNRAAEEILRHNDGLSINRAGHVAAASLADGTRLRQAIQSTGQPIDPSRPAPGGVVAVERPSGRVPYSVLVAPVRQEMSRLTSERVSAAIYISRKDFTATPELLSDALGITRAEAKVLSQLLTGCSTFDCGARIDISPHTARTHLRNMFGKLGVSNKVQLMRCVADHPIWMIRGDHCSS